MVAGSIWLPAGTASARRSKYRSKPAGASTSTNRATVSLGLAKVWAVPWGVRMKLPAGGGELSLLHGKQDRALQDQDGVVQLVVYVHGWVGAVGGDSALHDAEAPLGVAGHRLEGHGVGPEDQLPALIGTEEDHLRHILFPWRAR